MYDEQNVFSKIIKGDIPADIVYENEKAIAFYDIAPIFKIHVIVIPKGKYMDYTNFINNASDSEIIGFNKCIQKVVEILNLHDLGYRLVSNVRGYGGQEVFHLHFHILAGEKLPALSCE